MNKDVLQILTSARSQPLQLLVKILGDTTTLDEIGATILKELTKGSNWKWSPESGLLVCIPQDTEYRWIPRESVTDLENRVRPAVTAGGEPDPNAGRSLLRQEYVFLVGQIIHYGLQFAFTPTDAAAVIARMLELGKLQQPPKLRQPALKLRAKHASKGALLPVVLEPTQTAARSKIVVEIPPVASKAKRNKHAILLSPDYNRSHTRADKIQDSDVAAERDDLEADEEEEDEDGDDDEKEAEDEDEDEPEEQEEDDDNEDGSQISETAAVAGDDLDDEDYEVRSQTSESAMSPGPKGNWSAKQLRSSRGKGSRISSNPLTNSTRKSTPAPSTAVGRNTSHNNTAIGDGPYVSTPHSIKVLGERLVGGTISMLNHPLSLPHWLFKSRPDLRNVVIKKEASTRPDQAGGQPVTIGTSKAKKATSGQLKRRAVTAAKQVQTGVAEGRSIYSVPLSEGGTYIAHNVRERQKRASTAPSLVDDAFQKPKSSAGPVGEGVDNNPPTDVSGVDKFDAPDASPQEADTQIEASPQMRPPMKRHRLHRAVTIHPTIESDSHPTRKKTHVAPKTAHTQTERPISRIEMNGGTERQINSDHETKHAKSLKRAAEKIRRKHSRPKAQLSNPLSPPTSPVSSKNENAREPSVESACDGDSVASQASVEPGKRQASTAIQGLNAESVQPLSMPPPIGRKITKKALSEQDPMGPTLEAQLAP